MADAKKFLTEIVEPTLEEFRAEYSSVRRAVLAVLALDALMAQIYQQALDVGIDPFDLLGWHPQGTPSKPRDDLFRERICENFDAVRIVRDAAKTYKHAELTQGSPLVRRSDATVSMPGGWGVGPYGAGRYSGVDQVRLTLETGEQIFLEQSLWEAADPLRDLVQLLQQRIVAQYSSGKEQ